MSRIRIGLALLTSGALLLTGCGRSTDDDAPAKAGTIGTGPATGTITMWAQGAEAEQLPGLLKQFEAANPGVHVNVTAIPWPSAHDKYQAAIAAGTTPDIAQIGTTWMGEFAASGSVAQLPGDFGAAEFYGGAVKSTQVRGNTYGVPWYVDTPVLYYRTDLAAAAGFTAPPANWNDLKTMAKAMQTRAGAKYGIGLAPKDFQGFLPFAWSNGAGLTNPDGSKWTINTPQLVDAVRFYQSFFTEGIASKTPSTDAGAYISAFVDGSVPMFFGGPFEVSQINKAGGAGFAAKYATAVRPASKTATSFVGGSDLVVFSKSSNAASAWKLARFLCQPATQVAWYKTTGDLPSVQQAWTDPALTADPKLAVFGQQLKSVDAPPPTNQWAQIASYGDDQMERVTVSGVDPAEAMKTLQGQADSVGTGA